MTADIASAVRVEMSLDEAIALRNLLGHKPFPVSASAVHDFWWTLDNALAAKGFGIEGPTAQAG